MYFKRKICSCVFFSLFGKVAYICLFCLIFKACLNKIPARPQLCNFPLSKDKLPARPPANRENTLFFAFRVVEEIYLVVLKLCISCLCISCLANLESILILIRLNPKL